MAHLALLALMAASDLERGLALYRERNFTQAEQVLSRIIAVSPGNLTARLYLVRALIEQGRAPEALSQLERVLAGEPGPDLSYEAGRIFRELAERRAGELARVAPDSAAVHEIEGERLELAGRLEEAFGEYSRAAAAEPKRNGIHYRLGSVLWKQRRAEEAVLEFRAELANNENHGMANLRLGEALMYQGLDAQEVLQRAVSAMPQSSDAKRELGKAYRKAGRADSARRVWEMVARGKPNDGQIHFLLGGLYREIGEHARARSEFEKHRLILQRRLAQPESRAR